MKIIDLETYPRRDHFEFFRSMAYPYAGLTANVDVTDLVAAARARGGSVFLACLYGAARAANEVPEFRQRIVGDDIVEFEHCDTNHTVALADHTFCDCRTDCRLSFDDFLAEGRRRQEAAKQGHGFDVLGKDETDLIFVSCVPWVSFTQVLQPAPIPADSNPRIVFGKFAPQGERLLMPVGVQVNHALVDGYHMAQFYERMEAIGRSVR